MTRLQVRQLAVTIVHREHYKGGRLVSTTPGDPKTVVNHGSWHDVTSPHWLAGFVIPGPGVAYEFRNAPEGE